MAEQNIVFCGGCGATEFVRAIDQHAFAEGHTDDEKWIAEFAAGSLSGAAQVWYDELPVEYRTTWSMLRQALLNQFPEGSSSSPARTSLTIVTQPAEPFLLPPKRPRPVSSSALDQTYVSGRIRVVSPNYKGYISRYPHPEGMQRVQVTARAADALRVRYLPMEGPHNIEIQDRVHTYQTFLGATWYLQKTPKLEKGSSSHADLRLISPPAPKRGWDDFKKWVFYGSGSTRTSMWNVSRNGKVTATWVDETGLRHKLGVVGYYKSSSGEILLVGDKDVFLRANPGHEEARLVFEPC